MLMIPSIAPEAINFPSGLLIEKKFHVNQDKNFEYLNQVNSEDIKLNEWEKCKKSKSNIVFSLPINVIRQFWRKNSRNQEKNSAEKDKQIERKNPEWKQIERKQQKQTERKNRMKTDNEKTE